MGATGAAAPPQAHVTVDDVWHGALPEGTQLVAGAAGLRREVLWCTALRARPPAFEPLRGGELVLINPEVINAVDSRLTLPRMLESLAGQAIAAAAVVGKVAPDARKVADANHLPLFQVPASPALDQVEQHVLRYVVDRRAELHERAQDLQRQLSELALAGRGLAAVLERLYELIGVPVLLERDAAIDYVGSTRRLPERAMAAITAERPALEAWLRDVPLSAADPPVALRSLPEGQMRLVAPILAQGSIAGFLSLIGSEGDLGEIHRLAVGRAAHACAIELVRARAASDARDEVEDELLDVLTAGRPATVDAVRERAKRKGLDIDAPYLVLAAQAAEGRGGARIRSAWERVCATMRLAALVRERGEQTLALVSLNGRRAPTPQALVDHLHRAAKSAAGGPVALGYGAVRSGAAGVVVGAREAQQALAMGQRLFGRDSTTSFNDLGLYRLLYALQQVPELKGFRDEALARLRDRDKSGVLIETLTAYLATNGSPTDTADRLRLHRNTVLYRLGRIAVLLGADLKDADVRLTLHLALKIGDVLEA